MKHRNHALLPVLLSWALLVPAGCGGEEPVSHTIPAGNPKETPSCPMLEPLVFQDPRTGGAFHCLWCSREWKWTVPESHRSLFILIDLACEDLGSEAYVEIRNPEAAVVWKREVRQGDGDTYCVRYDEPPTGTYSVRLYGHRDFLFLHDLILEFRGSLHLKLLNERGECIPPFHG